MMQLLADVRYAHRLFGRAPGFSAAVVSVLALGIGANSAIFTALDQTAIRPLPYAAPDRLATLWEDFSAFGLPHNRVAPATFLDWRKRTQTFEAIAAYAGPRPMDLAGGGPPEEVAGLTVTADLLPILGVQPLLGRTLASDEEGPETKVAVLSYRLWQRRFGGDPRLVGRSILMSGEHYTVIGVMPRGFQYPDREPQLWLPLGLKPEVLARRNSHFLKVLGRLKPGADMRQAQADMSAVGRAIGREFPDTNARVGIQVVPLKDEMLGGSRTAFIILLSAAACVLLIACGNVGNLLLARVSGRRREIAVCTALGAAPRRVIRQILTENLLLASAGGALGLLLAHWTLVLLRRMIPEGLAGAVDLHLDLRVVAFTAAVSILTGALFGLAPALQLSRVGIYGAIKMSARGPGKRVGDWLAASEVALALVLVVGAVLLIQTLIKLRAVDPGFRSQGILTAEITAPYPKYLDSGKRQRFYNAVLARVRGIPGVQSAGLTSDLPYTSRGNYMSLAVEGQPQKQDLGQDALFRLVSAGYLQTVGASLRQGRLLEERDAQDALDVVVINESLARQYWQGQSALGHRIDTGTGDGAARWMTVVGVVADIRERGLDLGLKPAVYVPFPQTGIAFFQPSEIAVRTSRGPLEIPRELQQAVWAVDPDQPVSNIRIMDTIVDDELASRSHVLQLLGAFAGLALCRNRCGASPDFWISRSTRVSGTPSSSTALSNGCGSTAKKSFLCAERCGLAERKPSSTRVPMEGGETL